jgi:hypothetical protein
MIFLFSGVAILLLVLRDVFQTVLVPRAKISEYRLAPLLVRYLLWPAFRRAAKIFSSPEWKAELLGAFAPFVIVVLLSVWTTLLVTSFALMSFALAANYSPPIDSPITALYVSGSSVLTLGGTEYIAKSNNVRLLMIVASFVGVSVTASVVSLLFALIGSLQRRETLVSLVTNVAGAAPSGIALLETYSCVGGRELLNDCFKDCHKWCADVYETHRAYPILPYFRSNDALTSWVTALGAVLDSTSLLLSVNEQGGYLSARLTYEFGCRIMNSMSKHLYLDCRPTIEVSDDEFIGLYKRLEAAGYCSITDQNIAKERFIILRNQYSAAQATICDYLVLPTTPRATEHKSLLQSIIGMEV